MLLKKLTPLFAFISFLILVILSRELQMRFLLERGISSYTTHTVISIGVNILIATVAYLFISKYKLRDLGGIGKTKLIRPLLLIFPLYIILLNFPGIDDIPTDNLLSNVVILIIYCISIGISEELSLRGFLQSYMIKYFGNSRNSIVLSVVVAAFVFGLLHLLKFDKGVYGEISQVFYATFIGVMFGMLLLVTKRLAPLIIIHAIIDFVAKLDDMGVPKSIESPNQSTLTEAAITALIILPCFIYGMIISRKITVGTVITLEGTESK